MVKSFKYRNYLLRKNLSNKTLKYFSMKYLLLNKNIKFNLKFKIMLIFQKNYKFFPSQINNICIETNYPRSIMRLTNLSKSKFKERYAEGQMTGFRKSS